MDYIRITSIEDPFFKQMHELMQAVFPPEEVLEFGLWKEPLEDPGIRVFVPVHEGKVVGATEYRYYRDLQVAMTDFTIIGKEGLGIGPFLVKRREADLLQVVKESGGGLLGMFAEIYNPYLVKDYVFGGIKPMDPFVRREVLAHIGYRRLELDYVHPSWDLDGSAVRGLDLGFLTYREGMDAVPATLVRAFLERYYSVMPKKPEEWRRMIDSLDGRGDIALLPL